MDISRFRPSKIKFQAEFDQTQIIFKGLSRRDGGNGRAGSEETQFRSVTMSKPGTEKTQTKPVPPVNLQARYKPIGLPAVVAATQCRSDAAKARKEHGKRDLPAVLQAFYD